jgi:hypothetical protein
LSPLLPLYGAENSSAPEDFVFAPARHSSRSGQLVKRELKPAITNCERDAGREEPSPLPAFRWHDFRQARIAGHADPNVTLKVYAHLFQGALSQAAELYDPLRAETG